MNARNFLTLFFIIATLVLNAQSNYKEGNVITNNGNSIKGFINYREWHKNPDRIQFKDAISQTDARTLSVDSIAGFSITGYESYTRYTVPVSMGEIEFNKLAEVIDTTTETKSIFLKEMLKGDRVTLYSYTDEIKVRYYVQDKKDPFPYELVFRKILKENREISQALFKQQLSKLAADYGLLSPGMEDRISKASYSGNEIKKNHRQDQYGK